MKNIYQVAALKARTVWLQNLLLELLPQLSKDSTDYHTWFDSLIEVMQNRGLVEPTQQKDYLSDARNAIKVLDPDHPALAKLYGHLHDWSRRMAQRVTMSDATILANRGKSMRKGVLPFLADGSEVPEELLENYTGPTRQKHCPD